MENNNKYEITEEQITLSDLLKEEESEYYIFQEGKNVFYLDLKTFKKVKKKDLETGEEYTRIHCYIYLLTEDSLRRKKLTLTTYQYSVLKKALIEHIKKKGLFCENDIYYTEFYVKKKGNKTEYDVVELKCPEKSDLDKILNLKAVKESEKKLEKNNSEEQTSISDLTVEKIQVK